MKQWYNTVICNISFHLKISLPKLQRSDLTIYAPFFDILAVSMQRKAIFNFRGPRQNSSRNRGVEE